MKTPLRYLLAFIIGILAAPKADAREPFFHPVVSDAGMPPAAEVYRGIMANFRTRHAYLPFPADAQAIRDSYQRFEARSIFQVLETNAHLELLNHADPRHSLDEGFADPASRRNARVRNLLMWSLWLVSREAVFYPANFPEGDGGPWKARKLRGWGSKDFNNGSSDFRGWHTYSEQTSTPLIGMLTTVRNVQHYLADHPEMASRPVFTPQELRALVASERMRIEGVDLKKLTYAGAAKFLLAFSGDVLDWWIANAMTEKGNLRYFWYTSVGDALFGKTGHKARDWFVVHANQLMGRAAFLYSSLTGESRYRDLAVDLYGAFLTAHHPCRTLLDETTCYRYAVWGESLAPRVGNGANWALGTADPGEVKASPMRNLEEPFHMNSSHALVGLLHGHGLLNRYDFSGGADDLAAIQDSFGLLFSVTRDGDGCAYFTRQQCRTWPVAGPPKVVPRFGAWWVVGRDKLAPFERLAWRGREFEFPEVRTRAESLAAYYLTEGASDETFALLVAWWDAWGRRAEFEIERAGCTPRACPVAMSGANFAKMGVFLAAAAFERMGPGVQ